MVDFVRLSRDECAFWRTLVERGICIRKVGDKYRAYDANNTAFYGSDHKELKDVMDWLQTTILEESTSQPMHKETVSFLLTAMYNRGLGPEFVDCAVIAATCPKEAQAASYNIALTYFKKKIPKYEPDDTRIRPIPPSEMSRYDKLEKITV